MHNARTGDLFPLLRGVADHRPLARSLRREAGRVLTSGQTLRSICDAKVCSAAVNTRAAKQVMEAFSMLLD